MLAFAVLIGLGTWQVQRMTWKEGLIAALTERLAAAPVPLPPLAAWNGLDQAGDEYRRVTFSATFDHGREALIYAAASSFRPDVMGPGYWVFTPARLADGAFVIVNRGFVPEARKDPATARRRTDRRAGRDHRRDALARRATLVLAERRSLAQSLVRARSALDRGCQRVSPAAPFYVEQEAPAPPGGLPQPGKLVVNLPNQHLAICRHVVRPRAGSGGGVRGLGVRVAGAKAARWQP